MTVATSSAAGAKPGGAAKCMTPNTKARKIAKGRKRFDEMRAAREAASSDAPSLAEWSSAEDAAQRASLAAADGASESSG